jgi:hypothetical protein
MPHVHVPRLRMPMHTPVHVPMQMRVRTCPFTRQKKNSLGERVGAEVEAARRPRHIGDGPRPRREVHGCRQGPARPAGALLIHAV